MFRTFVLLFLAALLVAGCTTVRVPEAKQGAEVMALAVQLRSLSSAVDAGEAQRAADAAVRYPLELARQWHATPPAVVNNVLINAGLHPQGLCFQWADALTEKLLTLNLRTLELHRGVAHLGTTREHSCVVLTAPGQSFTNGVALDAWRYCGRLHWSLVPRDDFPWKEVALIPSYRAELEAAARQLRQDQSKRD